MNRNKSLKAVWATQDDCYTSAKQGENELSPDRVGTFTDTRKKSDFRNCEKDRNDSKTPSNPRLVSSEKQSNFMRFQNQGLFSAYELKNDLNSETSEDFEALPEEFRPNKVIQNTLPKNSFDENCIMEDTVNRALKYNTQKHIREYLVQSPDNKDPNSKGITWRDNLNINPLKNQRQFNREEQNPKIDKEQTKGVNVQNAYMWGKSHSEDNRYNKTVSDGKKKESNVRFPQTSTRSNPEFKKTIKNHSSPSMTVLSQVTKLTVVTPDSEVETRKSVQKTWTTNVSEEPKTKNQNRSGAGEVLFEHISRKAVKKITWKEDLRTVKENSDELNTFEYISRSKSKYTPPKQTKAPKQKKNGNFPVNKPYFDRRKDNTNEIRLSENIFTDQAEEFIRAQRRYRSERESQKSERISIPNQQLHDQVPVVQHIIKVIHVNQPIVRSGNQRNYTNRNNYTKFSNKCKPHHETQTSCENTELSWNRIVSDTNETENNLKENGNTLYQFSSKITANDQNKLNMSIVEESKCGLFSGGKDTGRNYSVLSEIRTTRFESPRRDVYNEDTQRKRSILIHFGEEISDTIVGSYTAMNMFLSFYKEWNNVRVKAMQLLENITSSISNTSNRRSKTKTVCEIVGDGGRIVAAIPHFQTALVGRIVATLSDFFAKMFSSSPTLKESGMNEFELMTCLQQDIDATSDMNIFGMQCDQNFQETCKLIEEFHYRVQGWCFKDISEEVDTEFLEDISTMNPKHHIVYYRRLQTWLERLAENPTTDISRAFTKGFKDFPEALKTSNLLHWRFHAQAIDETVNLRSWEEIRELLQKGDSVTGADILKTIQNCLLVLIKERSAMEKDVMELLQTKV